MHALAMGYGSELRVERLVCVGDGRVESNRKETL